MILAFSCLVIGLGLMGVSGYYSLLWFIKMGTPIPIACIFATAYVVFANITFEFGFEAFRNAGLWASKKGSQKTKNYTYELSLKKQRKEMVKGILIMLGWFFFAGYSIYCTVGGQYDQLMVVESEVEVVTEQVVDYSKLIALKEDSLHAYKDERAQLLVVTSSVESVEESWDYVNTLKATNERLSLVKENISNLENELVELYGLQSTQSYSEEFDISDRGYFVYISELSKGRWNPVRIQFYSALLPSIVVDIISPICLTIFVLWWKKRKKV